MNQENHKKAISRRQKILFSTLRLIRLLVLGLIGTIALGVGGCLLQILIIDLQRPPSPAGYADFFESTVWDANGISDFLGVRIPEDAQNLQIEGGKGVLGSYGITPRLKFSFEAPPDSATAFVHQFCTSVLHPGYNPFTSVDSASPSPDALLIRTGPTIHYSHSPGVPETVLGNRCYHDRWLIEITLDETIPSLYTVSYELSYDVNVNPEEYYPTAQYITPFGDKFRLYVTGFSQEKTTVGEIRYILNYPTICMQTADIARVYDYWTFNREAFNKYYSSAIQFLIDGQSQPPARINQNGSMVAVSDEGNPIESSEKWNYCLTDEWKKGIHIVQMVVTPSESSQQTFEWEFEVR